MGFILILNTINCGFKELLSCPRSWTLNGQSQHLKVKLSIRKPVFSQLFIICPQGKWYSSQGMGSQRQIFCWLEPAAFPHSWVRPGLLTCVQELSFCSSAACVSRGLLSVLLLWSPCQALLPGSTPCCPLWGDKALFLEAGRGEPAGSGMQGERFVLYFDQRPRHLQGTGFWGKRKSGPGTL